MQKMIWYFDFFDNQSFELISFTNQKSNCGKNLREYLLTIYEPLSFLLLKKGILLFWKICGPQIAFFYFNWSPSMQFQSSL